MPSPTKARMMLALYDAFQAGRQQGSDEATSYEWGQPPRIGADEAFNDLFEKWETGWSNRDHIRKALRHCK